MNHTATCLAVTTIAVDPDGSRPISAYATADADSFCNCGARERAKAEQLEIDAVLTLIAMQTSAIVQLQARVHLGRPATGDELRAILAALSESFSRLLPRRR